MRNRQTFPTYLFAFAIVVGFATPALAQDDDDRPERIRAADRPEKIDEMFSVRAAFNLVNNNDMVGQIDGTSLLLSGAIAGGLDYINGRHEVRNTLTWDTSWAKTPVLDEFVKNYDRILLEDMYSYYVSDWFGPFGRLTFQSSPFVTNRVTAEPVDYEIERINNNVDQRSTANLRLANSFEPFEFTQTVGFFAQLIRRVPLRLDARAGFGAREYLAEGVLVPQDDGETDVLEVVEIDDAIQAGLDTFVGAEGEFPEERISYRAGGTAFFPFINNDPQDRNGFELAVLGAKGELTFNFFRWMGVSYSIRLLSDPQVLDAVQVQNSLLVQFQYVFFERDKVGDIIEEEEKKEVETEAAPENRLDEARERAERAEERAEEAEERATELRQELEAAREQTEEAKEAAQEAREAAKEAREAAAEARSKAESEVQQEETPEQQAPEEQTQEEPTEQETAPE